MVQRTGQCLCGAVKITATLKDGTIQACHCVQCQRWTGGGPHFALHVSDVEISGEENIRSYRASEWGERANCATCGSVLFWRMQGKRPSSVAVGLLDDQSGLTLGDEIFTDRRAGWMHPWEGASQSTEAQEHEKLHAYLEKKK